MKKIILYIVVFYCVFPGNDFGQSSTDLLNNKEVMDIIKQGISYTYNYQFNEAEKIAHTLDSITPEHAISSFYKGLIIYWKYFPLLPNSPFFEEFRLYMNKAIDVSEQYLKTHNDDVLHSFLALISRGMLMMVYADNELPLKVIAYARPAYKYVIKGFDMKETFNEFYFTTGLYNYYIIAYPEVHTAYKPLLIFFRDGNKKLGLQQLDYASKNCTFIREEATLFLQFIYMNFENNRKTALKYAQQLHKLHPDNLFYLGKYTEMLLINKKYKQAVNPINRLLLENKDDKFAVMQGAIFKGLYQEKGKKDLEKAEKSYLAGVTLSKPFGPRADNYVAHAYFGLSRIYNKQKKHDLSRTYAKLAKETGEYTYLGDDD